MLTGVAPMRLFLAKLDEADAFAEFQVKLR